MKAQTTSKKLRKMSIKELESIANVYALKVSTFQKVGATDDEDYKRIAGELIHVVNIIDWKREQKKIKPKANY